MQKVPALDYLNLQEAAGFLNQFSEGVSKDLSAELSKIGYRAIYDSSSKNLITIYNTQTLRLIETEAYIYRKDYGQDEYGRQRKSGGLLTVAVFDKLKEGRLVALGNIHAGHANKLQGANWELYEGARIPESARPMAAASAAGAWSKYETTIDYYEALKAVAKKIRLNHGAALLVSGDTNHSPTETTEISDQEHCMLNLLTRPECATNFLGSDPEFGRLDRLFTRFNIGGARAKAFDGFIIFPGDAESLKFEELGGSQYVLSADGRISVMPKPPFLRQISCARNHAGELDEVLVRPLLALGADDVASGPEEQFDWVPPRPAAAAAVAASAADLKDRPKLTSGFGAKTADARQMLLDILSKHSEKFDLDLDGYSKGIRRYDRLSFGCIYKSGETSIEIVRHGESKRDHFFEINLFKFKEAFGAKIRLSGEEEERLLRELNQAFLKKIEQEAQGLPGSAPHAAAAYAQKGSGARWVAD